MIQSLRTALVFVAVAGLGGQVSMGQGTVTFGTGDLPLGPGALDVPVTQVFLFEPGIPLPNLNPFGIVEPSEPVRSFTPQVFALSLAAPRIPTMPNLVELVRFSFHHRCRAPRAPYRWPVWRSEHSPRSLHEQVILIEANRLEPLEDVAPGLLPPLPPTELTLPELDPTGVLHSPGVQVPEPTAGSLFLLGLSLAGVLRCRQAH